MKVLKYYSNPCRIKKLVFQSDSNVPKSPAHNETHGHSKINKFVLASTNLKSLD